MLMDEHETNYHCRHCEEERRSSPRNGVPLPQKSPLGDLGVNY
jgi:hypothetical protein